MRLIVLFVFIFSMVSSMALACTGITVKTTDNGIIQARTVEYGEENWFGVYVQNNCGITDHNANQVLKKAWEYLEDYFNWEEEQEEE